MPQYAIKNIKFRAAILAPKCSNHKDFQHYVMITIFNTIVGFRGLCQCFLCSFFQVWGAETEEVKNI